MYLFWGFEEFLGYIWGISGVFKGLSRELLGALYEGKMAEWGKEEGNKRGK